MTVALLSLLLYAGPAPDQTAARLDATALKVVDAYRAAAEDYRAGHTDTAAQTLARLDRSDLRTVVALLKTMRLVPAGAADPLTDVTRKLLWDRPLLLAAGMLHVDVAIGEDRQRRIDDFRFHTDLAASLFDTADVPGAGSGETPGTAAFRSAEAIALLLLGEGNIHVGHEYLSAALKRFPGAAPLLLAFGTLNETGAAIQIQLTPPVNDVTLLGRARAARDVWLREAEASFERALAVDPSLVEARVRLAHLRIVQHDDARAATLLDEALTAQPAPNWLYLANMMIGDIRRRAGRTDAAVQAYRDALNARPDGQSGYIAISHALYAAGDRTLAAQALERLFERRLTPTADDPWWDYPFGAWRDAEPMLDALRAEARR